MSLLIKTDVTAVKLYGKFILAGIGSWVHIFDRNSITLTQKIHALNGQKIYGFVPSDKNKVLVFGGKQFSILTRDDGFVKCFEAILCNDWLHSGIWLEGETIALLTAHNVTQIWNTSRQLLVKQYITKENSILYSGLLLPIIDDILVFSGTVFSEVLIHRCSRDAVLHRLKGHKGVIFSVSCNPQKGVIVTTSDDRSIRIWQINNTSHVPNSIDYWENANINCIHELFGHLARVMKNIIKEKFVVSIGEDACICFWGYDGTLFRKLSAHQNACIWSLDADDQDLLTGGGDSGVILYPLSMVMEYGASEVLDIEVTNAKKVVFTARRNIVVISESNDLVYYNSTDESSVIIKLQHKSTFKLLSISSCKQIVAVVDMAGKLDIFTETCKGKPNIKHFIDTKLEIGKIFFMEWTGNRHLVLCSDFGVVTVLAAKCNSVEVFAKFLLPPCKERWLTSAAIDLSKDIIVAADRCGSLHMYLIGQQNPTQSFKSIHGRYGATSINIRKNEMVTTGRDGTVKYFSIDENCKVELMSNQNLDFQWVEAFIDKDKRYICGFQERIFVVYDSKNSSKLLEVNCGGGRRAWDVVRYFEKVNNIYQEYIKFIYSKNAHINAETFELRKVVSKNVITGTHSKEINCLKIYGSEIDPSTKYFITGGEDTTLRISSLKYRKDFCDEVIFKQLSNVRTLKCSLIEKNIALIVSAGGRAQMCIKLLQFVNEGDEIKVVTKELCDYLINGTDKERKGNKTWRDCTIDFDPETRIMDLDIIKLDASNFVIVAGCSDAYLRVFDFEYDGNNAVLKLTQDLPYHNTCILKTYSLACQDKLLLITCTTRGIATFWTMKKANLENLQLTPLNSLFIHQSGINSLACKIVPEKKILLATGGDDNAFCLTLVEINEDEIKEVCKWSSCNLHCSEITGVMFVDDLVMTTSIDQRITLLRWRVDKEINCEFISQVFSDVADIQGLEIMEYDCDSITLCVFGKGFEVLTIERPSQ